MGLEMRVTDAEGSHKVELLLDGTALSWLSVIDLEVKVGSVYLKMGGMGGVGTLEQHRMKGYSKKVLEHSVDYMTKMGYDISMLYGIPDFYDRWGYASTLPDYKFTVPLRNARRAREGLHARPMTKEDAHQVLDIYELTNKDRTGPVRRHRDTWFRFRKGTDWRILADGTVFEDGSGKIVGYYASDRWPRVMRITEVGATETRFYENLLRHAATVADQKQATELEVFVPFDHDFANLCKRMGCTVKLDYQYDAMGMGRIIGLRSTLEKLAPELSRRIEQANFKVGASGLTFRTDIGDVTLELTSSGVVLSQGVSDNQVGISQSTLLQLILGYRTVADVLADQTTKTVGGVRGALEAMFPSGHPYIWLSDWF